MSEPVHVDDAFDFFARKLTEIPELQPITSRDDGYNIKASKVAADYWLDDRW